MNHKIDITKDRYDQSTYIGRLQHFSEITNPLNLLHSSSYLDSQKQLLKDYKAGLVNPTANELYKAKVLVQSTFHPDTGEKIFAPFRMSSFVPTNVPILAAMLLPNPSITLIIASQWINQSINVAFNYANANKTTEMSHSETAIAYAGAVISSCSIALGLNRVVDRFSVPPTFKSIISKAVPFVAVATAGTVNVYLMRRKELMCD